jgi:RNA polymerase sigma-70 factor, ECF subfamily
MMNTESEFKKIYSEYYQKILNYLSSIVGQNDAEDVAQDVFDKIGRNIGGFRGKSQLSTWIYRIATNTAIDRLRSASYKNSTEYITFEDASGLEESIEIAHQPHTTDHVVIRKEMSECVREYIDNLPPAYKTVIVLSELEGLSSRDISDILEISLENVKIRLHRARIKLREALNDGCDFYYNEQNALACDRKASQIFPKPKK